MSPPTAAQAFRGFGDWAASSPQYRRLAAAVAADPDVTAMLDALDAACRRPPLLFGVLRLHGVDVSAPATALVWVREHVELVVQELRARRIQTNEVLRCAALLPALALLPGPLALVEVGASAGLNLLLDRYRYRWIGAGGVTELGSGTGPVLECTVRGRVPLPGAMPRIAWRAGLDVAPVDPTDPDARAWLRALVWPEHTDRAERLAAALDLAVADPPEVVPGDLVDDLPALLDRVPAGLTTVVLHSVTLTYVTPGERAAFCGVLAERGAHRLGLESPGVMPDPAEPARPAPPGMMLLSLDGVVLALADQHGRCLQQPG